LTEQTKYDFLGGTAKMVNDKGHTIQIVDGNTSLHRKRLFPPQLHPVIAVAAPAWFMRRYTPGPL
jgi:hypothetical protein